MLMVFCTLATIEQQDEDKLGIQNSVFKGISRKIFILELKKNEIKQGSCGFYIHFNAVNYLKTEHLVTVAYKYEYHTLAGNKSIIPGQGEFGK
jgi:hypothetical protein